MAGENTTNTQDPAATSREISREELDAVVLRQLLAEALRACRFKRLPAHMPPSPKRSISHGPAEWLFVAWWAETVLLHELFGRSLIISAFAPLILLVVGGALSERRVGELLLVLVVGVAPIAGLLYSIAYRNELIVPAFIAPLAIATVVALSYRVAVTEFRDIAGIVAGVTRGAPLAAPLVLVFLLFPLMSRDLWEIASQLSATNLGWFALLTILVTFLIVYAKLRSEIEVVTTDSILTSSFSGDRGAKTRKAAKGALHRRSKHREYLGAVSDESIDAFWPIDPEEYRPYLNAIERKAIVSPLKYRLALTTVAFVVFLFAYVYLIASLGLPETTVDSWLTIQAGSTRIAGVELHTGAYIKLSALFSVIGTAGFLSFAVIEDRFSTALTAALLRRPVDRYLNLSLPFLALDEQLGDLDYKLDFES